MTFGDVHALGRFRIIYNIGHEKGIFVAYDLKINRITIEIGRGATVARDAGLAGSCTRRRNTNSRALSAVKVPRAPSAQTGAPARPNVSTIV